MGYIVIVVWHVNDQNYCHVVGYYPTDMGKAADAQTFSAKILEYLEIFDYARLVTHFLGKSIVM